MLHRLSFQRQPRRRSAARRAPRPACGSTATRQPPCAAEIARRERPHLLGRDLRCSRSSASRRYSQPVAVERRALELLSQNTWPVCSAVEQLEHRLGHPGQLVGGRAGGGEVRGDLLGRGEERRHLLGRQLRQREDVAAAVGVERPARADVTANSSRPARSRIASSRRLEKICASSSSLRLCGSAGRAAAGRPGDRPPRPGPPRRGGSARAAARWRPGTACGARASAAGAGSRGGSAPNVRDSAATTVSRSKSPNTSTSTGPCASSRDQTCLEAFGRGLRAAPSGVGRGEARVAVVQQPLEVAADHAVGIAAVAVVGEQQRSPWRARPAPRPSAACASLAANR